MVIALMILPALVLPLNSDRDTASISSQWRVKPASGMSRLMGVQQLPANVPGAMSLSSGSCVLFDDMIIMPGCDYGFECGKLFGKFPGRLGHLHNGDTAKTPRPSIYWALDNGIYGSWQSGTEWSEEPLYSFLERFGTFKPEWVAVPDAVADRELTLERWDTHAEVIASFGVPLAFVVQDGMTPADVPDEAEVVFVGGSTSFKWRTLRTWCDNFERVHVGRVNTERHLWQCHDAGAESCDGTGWFRGGETRLSGLVRYLETSTAGERPQLEMQLTKQT